MAPAAEALSDDMPHTAGPKPKAARESVNSSLSTLTPPAHKFQMGTHMLLNARGHQRVNEKAAWVSEGRPGGPSLLRWHWPSHAGSPGLSPHL